MLNLRWSWHAGHAGAVRGDRPGRPGGGGQRPGRPARCGAAGAPARLAGDRRYLRRLGRRGRPARVPDRAALVPAERGRAEGADAPPAIAYFSPEYGIAGACRSTRAASASWPATTSRRPATSACRSSGSACSTGTATSASRCPPRAGSWSTTRRSTRTGCRSTLLRDGDGTPVGIAVSPGRGPHELAAQVWLAQVGRVPLLLLDSDVEENDPALREVTDRLYGGGTEHRLRRRCCSASAGAGGAGVLRARPATRSRRSSTPTRATPASSAWSGSASYAQAGLGFDEAIEAVRAGTVFTTHTPVPAGHRPVPRATWSRAISAATAARPALPDRPDARAGRGDLPGGDAGRVQHGRDGHAAGAAGQRGEPSCTAQVSREMFAGLWPGFDADEVPIGSITNGVHARHLGGAARSWSCAGDGELARPGVAARTAGLGTGRQRPAGADLGDPPPAARAAGRTRPGTGSARPGGSAARPTPSSAGPTRRSTPSVLTIGFARRVPSYKRLTLMLRDPGRLRALLLDPAAPGPDRHRGQGAPGRRGRQAAHPADGAVRRRPGGPAPHRVPARLRHGAGPVPGAGLRRVAEQPAPAAGGVRHLRHEVGAQRRAQPVGPRRLVGRVVRRRERLGDPDRRRRRGPRPPRRAGGGRPVRPDRDDGGAAVLRPGRGRAARPVAGDGRAHAPHPRAAGRRRRGWSGTT